MHWDEIWINSNGFWNSLCCLHFLWWGRLVPDFNRYIPKWIDAHIVVENTICPALKNDTSRWKQCCHGFDNCTELRRQESMEGEWDFHDYNWNSKDYHKMNAQETGHKNLEFVHHDMSDMKLKFYLLYVSLVSLCVTTLKKKCPVFIFIYKIMHALNFYACCILIYPR